MYGSVGAPGEQSPGATRPFASLRSRLSSRQTTTRIVVGNDQLQGGEKNRREEEVSISKAPAPPPLAPPFARWGKESVAFARGGKRIGRSHRRSIARNKNTRLETVPPVRSTPTFHRPGLAPPVPRDFSDPTTGAASGQGPRPAPQWQERPA